MRDGFRVFDAHSHIGTWGSWEVKGNEVDPFDREFTSKKELREHMEKYGVDRQIVMPHYHPDLEITFSMNDLAVEMTELEGVYAGVFFDPTMPDTLESVVEKAQREEVRVLKASADTWRNTDYDPSNWSDKSREYMERLFEIAEREDMVFQLHTGKDSSDPRKIFDMVDAYPEVTYHLVHMGGDTGGHFALVPRFLERLESHEIFCDTSWSRGFAPRWMARKLKDRDELERMMFATDEPWGDFPSEFNKLKGLELDEDEKQRILHGNASKLYE